MAIRALTDHASGDDYEEQTVEFEDGTEVTVTSRGEVVAVNEPTPEDEFFDAISEKTKVERLNTKKAFFSDTHLNLAQDYGNGVDINALADEHGVTIQSLWPTYKDENTDLEYYIRLE